LFYLLVFYVLAQFGWWAYLLMDLNQEVLFQEARFQHVLSPEDDPEVTRELGRRIGMILGEGAVFLVILSFGVWRLRKAFRKEMALANQQRNFLLSVTHELKSPVASIKLYLQTLQKRNLTPEKQSEVVSKTIQDVNRLQSLVENILTATRIENSTVPITKEKFNASELLQKQLDMAIETMGSRHTTKANIEPNIFLVADQLALESIFLNLYENAVKYAQPNTQINVSFSNNNSGVQLIVADNGKGIPEDQQQAIFDKFYRIGNEETRSTKGTGLGLYIVKSLVELHQGTVKVQPNQPQGSKFIVHLNTPM